VEPKLYLGQNPPRVVAPTEEEDSYTTETALFHLNKTACNSYTKQLEMPTNILYRSDLRFLGWSHFGLGSTNLPEKYSFSVFRVQY